MGCLLEPTPCCLLFRLESKQRAAVKALFLLQFLDKWNSGMTFGIQDISASLEAKCSTE